MAVDAIGWGGDAGGGDGSRSASAARSIRCWLLSGTIRPYRGTGYPPRCSLRVTRLSTGLAGISTSTGSAGGGGLRPTERPPGAILRPRVTGEGGPMNRSSQPDDVLSARLLDVMIRAGLIGLLAALCYVVFAPFLTLMVWAMVLAVVLHPMQQWLARRMGGRIGVASTLIVIAGVVLLVVPTAVLMDSFGGSVHGLVSAVRDNTLVIPEPPESI